MKHVIIISIILVSMGVSPQVDARHHHDLPHAVVVSLSNRYHHFDLIHTERIYRRGRLVFNLLIQHGNSYVEVTMGQRGGFIYETPYRHYPLADHYCDDYCSFQYQHYENGHFSSYDPYVGCHTHMDVVARRHYHQPYRPYYGYGHIHYHPRLRVYKRFRPYYVPPSGYRVHRGKKYYDRNYDGRYHGKRHGKHRYYQYQDHQRVDRHYHDMGRYRG